MKHKAYLLIFPAILVFLGISLANMHPNEFKESNTSTHSTTEITNNPQTYEPTLRGKLLYEIHCNGCHGKYIHNRISEKVNSVHDIRQWVIRWSRNLELGWSRTDIDLVTEYLDLQFYQFSTSE